MEAVAKKFNKSSDWWKYVRENPELKTVLDKLKENGVFDFEEKAKNIGSPFEKIKNKYGRTKVNYDCFGFPDFMPFVLKQIVINGVSRSVSTVIDIGEVAGTNDYKSVDFEKANQALAQQLGIPYQKFQGINIDDIQYTWHHHQDGRHMMLVPTDLNGFNGARHPGAVSLKKAYDNLNLKYDNLNLKLTDSLPGPKTKFLCD
ncbi:MAG: HNH endonuclease [Emticicia sp.]|nr:HNH endonuclease [Emticicia sp.]